MGLKCVESTAHFEIEFCAKCHCSLFKTVRAEKFWIHLTGGVKSLN